MNKTASTSLLTEHLRWTPLSLIDDIINTVNQLLYQSVAAVEIFLLNSSPSLLGFTPPPGTIPDTDGDGNIIYSEKEEEEINKGVHSLETLLENGVDKSFDKFEIYVLRNIFFVPEDLVGWVRLAHHKNLDLSTIPQQPVPSSPSHATPATTLPPAHEAQSRLRTLRQTLLASHALNQTLQSEINTNNRTLSQLRLLVSSSSSFSASDGETSQNPFAFLAANGGIKDTKDTASFAVSQVELIRSLVSTLRPKYDAFKAQQAAQKEEDAEGEVKQEGEDTEMTDASSSAPLTAEEERKRYIERMTRRHMEASRGLRLNAQGRIVGGDFEGAAKKGLVEVEALEGAADGMGVVKKGGEGGRADAVSEMIIYG